MDKAAAKSILEDVAAHRISPDEGKQRLKRLAMPDVRVEDRDDVDADEQGSLDVDLHSRVRAAVQQAESAKNL